MTAPIPGREGGSSLISTHREDPALTGRYSSRQWRSFSPCLESSECSLRSAVAARATDDGSQPWRSPSGAHFSESCCGGWCMWRHSRDHDRQALICTGPSTIGWRCSPCRTGVTACDERQCVVREQQGPRAGEPRDGTAESDSAHRSLRLRKVDLSEDPQPYARARTERGPLRIGQARRHGHLLFRRAGYADAPPDRHGVSAPKSVSLHDHRSKCPFWTAAFGDQGAKS